MLSKLWVYHEFTKNKKLKSWGILNPLKNLHEGNKMPTIREKAKGYESPETKNICELEEVHTELNLTEETFTDSDGKEFTVNTSEIEGEKYRVPNSVLKQLKVLLTDKPDLLTFKVIKSGEGMKTSYQVIPLK